MIKPEELRIDNYVTDYHNYSTYKVESLNDKGINLYIENDGNWPEIAQEWIEPEYKSEDIYPIEISDKWLEKLNFKKQDEMYFSYTDKNGNLFKLVYEGAHFTLYKVYGNYIVPLQDFRYVHDLQNFIYDITKDYSE